LRGGRGKAWRDAVPLVYGGDSIINPSYPRTEPGAIMLAHKRYVTIPPSGSLVLEGLPFRPGQRVEVVLLPMKMSVRRSPPDSGHCSKKPRHCPAPPR
jgi:hypothetical protein